MVTVSSFVADLASRTRPDRAASWDPVGLQLGDPGREVTRIAVCHEVTESVVDRVVAEPPDLLVSYHPLLFRPTTNLVAGPGPTGRAWRLVDAGISLAVTHTDFDACPGGTADALAAELALVDTVPFGPVAPSAQVAIVTYVPVDHADQVVAAMSAAGAGRIGNYDNCSYRSAGTGTFRGSEASSPVVGNRGELTSVEELRVEMVAPKSAEAAVVAALAHSHPYEEPAFNVFDARSNLGFIGRVGSRGGSLEELAAEVAEKLGPPGLRVAGPADHECRRVAVVPGSGSSFIGAARAAGADVIVTGDVDHHQAVAARDRGMAVIDPGHAATELPGMRALATMVASFGVPTDDLTGDGSGPWSHFTGDSLP